MNYIIRSILLEFLEFKDKVNLLSIFYTDSDIIRSTEANIEFYRKMVELSPMKLLQKYINIKINDTKLHEQAYIYALMIDNIEAADIISMHLGPIPERALEIAGNNVSIEQLKLVQKHMNIVKPKDYYKIFSYIQNNRFMHLRYICNAQNITFDDDGLLSIKLAMQHNNQKIMDMIYKNSDYDRNKLISIMNFELRNSLAPLL